MGRQRMSKDKVRIEKLQIKVSDKKIDLTIEEAKELQQVLNNTFPVAPAVSFRTIVERERYPWVSPWWGIHPPYVGDSPSKSQTNICDTQVTYTGSTKCLNVDL